MEAARDAGVATRAQGRREPIIAMYTIATMMMTRGVSFVHRFVLVVVVVPGEGRALAPVPGGLGAARGERGGVAPGDVAEEGLAPAALGGGQGGGAAPQKRGLDRVPPLVVRRRAETRADEQDDQGREREAQGEGDVERALAGGEERGARAAEGRARRARRRALHRKRPAL